MPVTAVTVDPEALTMTVVADFTAPVRRLWDAYSDPRQLEKFWGPPEWPATFFRHDLYPGGFSNYRMTGPDGESSGGYWHWVSVDEGRSTEVIDGFANDDGTPNNELPTTRILSEFAETALGSRLTVTSWFNSLADLEQLTAMGMEEGMRAAMAQIDAVLADLKSFAVGAGTELQLIGDNQVRISRIIRGTVDQVWKAHNDASRLRRWLLGPDGWTMPVCDVATNPGDQYRYEWENAEGEARFGFTGELMEASAPHRSVTTEKMVTSEDPDGAASAQTLNELNLTRVEGGTLMSLMITYPDADIREIILATGMVDGMETSYARLENEVLAA